MVTKKQIGLLSDFVRWTRTGALLDPFSYYIQDGIVNYEKSTYYKLQNAWPDFEKDLQAMIDAGLVSKIIIDGKTNYSPTEAGKQASVR